MKTLRLAIAALVSCGLTWAGPAASVAERAAQGIEQHRKGDGLLVFRRPDGHPAVEAIIYFGLTDADPPGCPKVCLLDEQYRPKPAWDRLRRLIGEEWTTRLTATATAEGQVRFRGFYGSYALQVRDNGSVWRFQLHLRPGQPGRWEFTLDPDKGEPIK